MKIVTHTQYMQAQPKDKRAHLGFITQKHDRLTQECGCVTSATRERGIHESASQPASQTSTQGRKKKDRQSGEWKGEHNGGVNRCWKLNTGGEKTYRE